MELWRRRVLGSLWLGYRHRIVDIHGVSMGCDVSLNSGAWVVVLALVYGSRRRWRSHVLTTLPACIGEKSGFFEISTISTINLTLVVILNHCLRLGAHVSSDSSEVGTKVPDVLHKITLLGHRPIA